MANANSSYVAKKAATLTNPLTTDQVFLQSDDSTQAAYVSAYMGGEVAGTSLLDGKLFYVRASGTAYIGTSSTYIATIYYASKARTSILYNSTGTATTAATFTSASATAPYNANWVIECYFIWDYTSQILNGWFTTLNGNATPVVTTAVITTQQTSVDLSQPGPGFVCTGRLGTSGATSTMKLKEFILEVL